MSTVTEHLGLIKPDTTDNVDISAINSNMETLDKEITDLKTDYVIAYGTQNGWTYRRWDSGLMECYARIKVSFNTNIVWHNVWRSEVGLYQQTYPVPFISTPVLVRSFDSDKGTSWALASSGATKSTTGGTMFANANKVSEAGYLSFFAQGRWK